ncbi:MAG: phosphoribosylglycinamide formyltransferase [Betaproteobacteria bacterium]
MSAPLRNIVVLISGVGSNLHALIEAARQEQWAQQLQARMVAVISNRSHAPGLAWARAAGLACEVIEHTAYPSRETFDAALMKSIDAHSPALVLLAGFMRILTPDFVRHYQGRLINIHPSLLPAFTGLHTHRRALEAGCKVAGATVHEVTAELDHGPILAQAAVPVLPGDNPESLAARVRAAEHQIYPQAVREWLKAHPGQPSP